MPVERLIGESQNTWKFLQEANPQISRDEVKEYKICQKLLPPITRFHVKKFAEPKRQ